MAIPIYERQLGASPLPGARAQSFVSSESIGPDIARLGAAVQAKVDEFEDARTLEALNAFRRELDDYHLNPEKGLYASRQGRNSFGAADAADAFIDGRIWEHSKGLPSKRAASNFARLAGQERENRRAVNMKWEFAQLEAYKTAEANAAIANGMDAIARNYSDEEFVQAQTAEMEQAQELKLRNAGPEEWKAGQAALTSGIAMTRFLAWMDADPGGADAWLKKNRGLFTAEDAAKAEALTENHEARSAADSALAMFGGEYDAAAGIAWIRKNVHDPDLADKAVSAYAGLLRERNLAYSLAEQKRNDIQQQNSGVLAMDYAKGVIHPDSEIVGMVENGDLSADDGARLISYNAGLADYGAALRYLQKTPGWNGLSESQQDTRLMSVIAGTTPETHAAAVGILNEGLTTGATSEATVKDYVNRGLITREDARRFIASLKGFDAASKAAANGIKKEFADRMNPGAEKSAFKGKYSADFFLLKKTDLDAYVAELAAEKDPDIARKAGLKALELQNEIIQEIYDTTGESQNDTVRVPNFFLPEMLERREDSRYAVSVRQAKENLEEMIKAGMALRPKPVEAAKMDAVAPASSGQFQQAMPSAMRKRGVAGLYGGTVSRASLEFGVPEPLVWAVMEMESGGNADAISSAGAVGLMQLMPSTASGLGVDPSDPHQNIRGGVKYLGGLLKQYGGDIGAALAHYNGGGKNAKAYLSGRKVAPETARYVPRVMELYRKYETAAASIPTAQAAPAEVGGLTDERISVMTEDELYDYLDRTED
jgi:soluble lytic murein transglycosylase-like protein